MHQTNTIRGFIAGVGVLLTAVGCAAHRQASDIEPVGAEARVAFDAEAYPEVFEATMDALGDLRFTPDRIDARRGVITTYPKTTAGLASPWDREQSSLGQEGQDFFHQQERVCRIVFEPADAPTTALIEVTVLRVRRPGWRVETDAVSRSSHAVDPIARAAGDGPEYRDPIGSDHLLAERLRARIVAALAESVQAQVQP